MSRRRRAAAFAVAGCLGIAAIGLLLADASPNVDVHVAGEGARTTEPGRPLPVSKVQFPVPHIDLVFEAFGNLWVGSADPDGAASHLWSADLTSGEVADRGEVPGVIYAAASSGESLWIRTTATESHPISIGGEVGDNGLFVLASTDDGAPAPLAVLVGDGPMAEVDGQLVAIDHESVVGVDGERVLFRQALADSVEPVPGLNGVTLLTASDSKLYGYNQSTKSVVVIDPETGDAQTSGDQQSFSFVKGFAATARGLWFQAEDGQIVFGPSAGAVVVSPLPPQSELLGAVDEMHVLVNTTSGLTVLDESMRAAQGPKLAPGEILRLLRPGPDAIVVGVRFSTDATVVEVASVRD